MKKLTIATLASAALSVCFAFAYEPIAEAPSLVLRDFEFDSNSGFASMTWNSVEGRTYVIEELGDPELGWLQNEEIIQGIAGETVWEFQPRSPADKVTLFRVRELSSALTVHDDEASQLASERALLAAERERLAEEWKRLAAERERFEKRQNAAEPSPMLDSCRFASIREGGKPSFSSAAASVRVTGPVNLAPFEIGKPLWSSNDRLHWKSVPEGLEGARFTQFDSQYKAFTEFTVESSGTVFLAVTSRWSLLEDRVGEGIQDRTSKQAFLAQGWQEIGPLHETSDDIGHEHRWILYSRVCQAGDYYRLRTEQYCSPILFQVNR